VKPAAVGAAILAGVLGTCAWGACDKAQSAAAAKAIDRVLNWEQLHKAYRDYTACDTGANADAFTDALLRLAVDWKNPQSLASAMKSDAAFHDFVITHLQSDRSKDDREDVYSRAKASCPAGLEPFCAEIAAVVKPARAAPAKPSADDTLDLTPLPVPPRTPAPAGGSH
jgi:hypothetical protein